MKLGVSVPAVAVKIGRERRRLREESQAKGQRAEQDEPQHGPIVSCVFERVQGDEDRARRRPAPGP